MDSPPSSPCWLGFDLGGTKMFATLYDGEFQPLARERKKTKGHEGADAGVARIVGLIRRVLEQSQLPPERLGGIGIGVPGPLDLDKGMILSLPNLNWKNVPLKKLLEKEFGCPAVVLNDVDAGVYGEYRFGAGRGARCAVGIFPGTGIGGGCVYEGRILRGRTSSCLEIGHIVVTPNGRLCGCGQFGCLEAEASRLAISAAVAKAAYRGEAPTLLELAGTDLQNIKSSTLAQAIKGGDKVVERIVRHAAEQIGQATATVVNLLAPDVVILGGGLVEAIPELIVETVQETARDRVMSAFTKSFKVTAAALGDDAGVMGAAAWAREAGGAAVP